MSTTPAPTLVQESMPAAEDEIDLRQVAAALGRQKKLIAGTAGAAVALSALFAFTREPVWEGQFQIVLENQDSGGGRLSQLAASNPLLVNLAGVGGGGGSQLETEVKVLESPSVLKPVYDFVKASKANSGGNVSTLTFLGWREGLKIELERGTAVLNIAYRDTNPDLVLPVIEQISQEYQRYSGRDRKRGLAQGVSYLEKQVSELSEQSEQSMRQVQAYALVNGLGLRDGMPAVVATGSTPAASVEVSREAAQNRVNALQQQLASARRVGNRSVFQAPQLQANAELFGQLQALEAELLEKQTLLKPNDDSIRRLTRQRLSLIAYINQQTIGLLEGELMTAQSQLTSLSRPREVVLKHMELVRTALRDERTLAELETQLQTLRLEQARQTDPWELISTPTLLDNPVAPRKKRIVTLGLLGGLVLGCGAALIRDRLSGLVFSEDKLRTSSAGPLLERLPLRQTKSWAMACELLAQGPLKHAQSVALIPVGQPDSNALQALKKTLQSALSGRSLLLSDDLVQTRNCDTQVLLIQPGSCSRSQLAQLQQSLALQGTPVAGWLLLDPTKEAV